MNTTNTPSDNSPENDDVSRVLKNTLGDRMPETATEQMKRLLRKLRQNLEQHPYVRKLERQRNPRRPRFWNRVFGQHSVPWLAGAGAATILLALIFLVGSNAPTWAQITERFRSVPFFSATVYIRDGVLEPVRQYELWMGRGGRARMRVETQVVFARNGKVTKAFDLKTRQEVEPDRMASQIVEMLTKETSFSLDTLLGAMRSPETSAITDVTPRVNADAAISDEMVVFDVELVQSHDWMRVWALRKSKLPVQIRLWDPDDGLCMDALFAYSKDQPDIFFDPEAYAEALKKDSGSTTDRAYMFLKDPGGRQISPENVFDAKGGYHAPTVEQMGITKAGEVWVVSTNAINRTPKGYPLLGFGGLSDDLRRQYVRVHRSPHGMVGAPNSGDRVLEIFVPLDYPFDERVPSRLTLILQSGNLDTVREAEIISTLECEAKDWEQDSGWPAEMLAPEKLRSRISLSNALLLSKDWPRLERLAAEGSPNEQERHHLQRTLCSALRMQNQKAEAMVLAEEIVKTLETNIAKGQASPFECNLYLNLLLEEGRNDEAVALADKYLPLMEKAYAQGKELIVGFGPALAAIVTVRGKDAARDVFRRLEKIQPEKRYRRDTWEQDFNGHLFILAQDLSHKAHLRVEDVSYVLGADVKKDERFKHFIGWDWDPEQEEWREKRKPGIEAWNKRLMKIAEYYKTHPLPDRMELLKRKADESLICETQDIPGIETHKARPLSGRFMKHLNPDYLAGGPGTLRLAKDVADVELSANLVYKADVGYEEQIPFVLDQLGMEIVRATEPRKVWVARYDGRPLKPADQVRLPPDTKPASMGASMTMKELFRDFMRWQDVDLQADKIIIIDETGLRSLPDKPTAEDLKKATVVSKVGPMWRGPEAVEKARVWFERNFGVTFTEEVRPMTVYVIQKKAAGR